MHISHAILLFETFKRGEGIKPVTLKTYKMHLDFFINSLPPERQDLNEIKSSDIVNFLDSERKRGLSPVTILDRYRALSAFFYWCEDNEELGSPKNPIRVGRSQKVGKPRIPKKQPRRAKLEDVKRLIASIGHETWLDFRNRAIITLMLDTGLRASEVCNLDLADIDIKDRLVLVRAGKNDKDRFVPFTQATAQILMTWHLTRPACPEQFVNALFLAAANGTGRHAIGRLSASGLGQIFEVLCQKASLPKMTPHSIRHLFATKAINNGIRAEVVSKMMGHFSVDFTLRTYAFLNNETMQREYNQHWEK